MSYLWYNLYSYSKMTIGIADSLIEKLVSISPCLSLMSVLGLL